MLLATLETLPLFLLINLDMLYACCGVSKSIFKLESIATGLVVAWIE